MFKVKFKKSNVMHQKLKSASGADTMPAPLHPHGGLRAPVIGILGAKGGSGATTVAVNLAAAFAQQDLHAILLDANLQQPDAACLVACEPEYSLLELIERSDQADGDLIESVGIKLQAGKGKLSLLSPPLNGQAVALCDLSRLSLCLDNIRPLADVWVVDLSNRLDKHLVNLLDRCDFVVVVFEASITGIAACRRWMDTFVELGYEDEKIICLLNRSGARKDSIEKAVANCFSRRQIFKLPNVFSAAFDCSAQGEILVVAQPQNPYSQAVRRLAQLLIG